MSNKMSENEKSKAQKNGFSRWFRWLLPPIEGTVAEPWTTPEELLNNKKLQEDIKKARELFADVEKQQSNQ